MAYVDENNVQHQIYLPKGTASLASALFVAKNWDELAKFPPLWYTDASRCLKE